MGARADCNARATTINSNNSTYTQYAEGFIFYFFFSNYPPRVLCISSSDGTSIDMDFTLLD